MKKRIFPTLLLLLVALTAMGAKKPKYIFYFIGDGMGLSPVLLAETYNQDVLGNKKPLLMLQFPIASMATTYSASHTITDSAAGGTALATGHKTKNGMLGVDADTAAVKSIAYELKEQGYGIAIATSVAPDDATPGAFYTHVDHRNKFYDITKDMAQSGFDMFAGGHLRGSAPLGEPDVRTVLANAGYSVVDGPAKWNEQKHGNKVVLLNQPYHLDHIGYTIDSIQGNLTLPFITKACLEHLKKVSPKRFFMMIEGGLIDHALHPNDAGAAVKELLNFDESLRLAYDFYLKHKDETLIIVTADHETGGIVLGYTGQYKLNLKELASQKVSVDKLTAMLKGLGKTTWGDIAAIVKENIGVEPRGNHSSDEAVEITSDLAGRIANEAIYDLDRKALISWASGNHSGTFVPLFAIGEGADKFNGVIDNTDIPLTIMEFLGIDTKLKGQFCGKRK